MPENKRNDISPVEALSRLKDVERYLQLIVRAPQAARPVTEGEVQDLVAEAKEDVRDEIAKANAFILAFLQDEPIPLKFFKPWGSKPTFLEWEREGLKLERFNCKTMVRPKVFFEFLEAQLGKGRAEDSH